MMLKKKKGIIMGIANERSLAWGVAQALHAQGAQLAITYQNEILKKRVTPLAKQVDCNIILECDAGDQSSIDRAFQELEKEWREIDFLIHAIGFSDKNELKGMFVDTSKDNFLNTLDISCYSFIAVSRSASRLMKNGGSLVTLTYYGAKKFIPNYNVMGVAKAALEASVRYMAVDLGKENIRVNAISAGPARTLAASGIGDFRLVFKWNEANSPLRRNINIIDVGNSAAYLVSDLSSAVTGEVLYVDSGYHVMGMPVFETVEKMKLLS